MAFSLQFMDHLMAGIEDILGKHGNHHMRDKFKRFDNRFIRPFLLRNYQVSDHCEKLNFKMLWINAIV